MSNQPGSCGLLRQAPSQIERLALEWVPGQGPLAIERLGFGLVNESYRIDRDGRGYTLRIAVSHAAMLGIDRAWECRVLRAASDAHLAPIVECCEPDKGILVTRWLDGDPWPPAGLGAQRSAESIGRLARRIHSLPIPPRAREMSPASWSLHYQTALALHGVAVPDPLKFRAAARLAALARMPPAPRALCHSDLHTQNLLQTERGLMVLDWEYAHVGEPLWDIAGWISNNDLGREYEPLILGSYFEGRPPASWAARLGALIWMYGYVCWLWGTLYLRLRAGSADEAVAARTELLAARLERDFE